VRRLYSTFAGGLPGLGLLLIRLAVGVTACAHGIEQLRAGALTPFFVIALLHLVLGALILIGLWTPVAGILLALTAIVDAFMHPSMRGYWAFAGTVAAAVALIGPGRWSVDVRLYGWKSLKIPDRKRSDPRA
jgi:uncharacterized membrane protein YphA (DoxX/SURF4 family)